MTNVYFYLLDTFADWECGYILSELASKRFFKKEAPQINLSTVSLSQEPIHSMGGLTIIPDCLVSDIEISKDSVLILPGANSWALPEHASIIDTASNLLTAGGLVCAICGATTALAAAGILDTRKHTSNGTGFLEMMVPRYKGTACYIAEPSVCDANLITAGSTAGLLWAKQILEKLDVFSPSTLLAWYNYFNTGKAEHFFAIMQSTQQ